MTSGHTGKDRISKAEISKDAVQSTVEATAHTVGEVAGILTSAVKDVAGAIGGLATEVFEIRTSRRSSGSRSGGTTPAGGLRPATPADRPGRSPRPSGTVRPSRTR